MLCVLGIILSTSQIVAIAQTPITNAYYAYYSGYPIENDSIEIFLIDPRDATVRDHTITIPLSGYSIQTTLVSQNGRYIALMLLTDSDERWRGHFGAIYRFYDVWTGEIFDSESFYVNFDFLYPFMASWSPQSNAFIFMANTVAGETLYDPDATSIYVMSMETRSQSLSNITHTQYFQWTPNERYWIESRNTAPHLSLIDASTQEIVLTGTIENAIPAQDNLYPCNFEFAENQPYIFFTYPCLDSSLYSTVDYIGWFEDVYLWNTDTNEIQRITNFTNPLEEFDFVNFSNMPPSRTYNMQYGYIWHDEELLISALNVTSHEVDADAIALTIAYNPQTQSTRTVTEAYRSYLSLNPTNGFITSVTEIYDPEQTLQYQNLEVATYNNSEFSLVYQQPPGCNLRWSPDWKWLFYDPFIVSENGPTCFSSTDTWEISFLDGLTGEVQHTTIENLNARIDVLGWLTLPDGNPPVFSFPNGTPTPLPPTQTPGPSG